LSSDELPEIGAEERVVSAGFGVERYLQRIYQKAKEDWAWHNEGIHVLDLVAECERSVVLRKLFPRGININTLLYIEDGRSKHTIVLGDPEFHEYKIEYMGIRGTIDDYDSKTGTIFEKKTTMRLPKSPRPEHELQLKYYGAMMKELGFKVNTGIIIYILRTMDDLPIEFQYDFSNLDAKAILNSMLLRANNLKEMIKKRELPKRNISWYCWYCPVSDICFEFEDKVPEDKIADTTMK